MYRRMISLLLCLCLILMGCGVSSSADIQNETSAVEIQSTEDDNNFSEEIIEDNTEINDSVSFKGLDDAELLLYTEKTVYSELIEELDSDEYFVENVNAVYLSQEYINDVAYNSQSNVFFGYSLDELETQFQGKRYVFTLGDDGQTTVVELEEVYDNTYDQIIKNVAIGSGVILVCVTVSVATAGTAPAVSMIFAASATTGTTFALESGTLSFAAASIARGYQTQDFDQAMKAGALAASDGFKWGAIIGGVSGGVTEGLALKGATLNGLTMNEAAAIQQESGYSVDIIKQFHSTEEYEIYKEAGLTTKTINGNNALVRGDIDFNYKSTLPDGTEVTNLERMKLGYAPLDSSTGEAYQLHHIGQKADGSIAVLTSEEHQQNAAILNIAGKSSEINRTAFAEFRKNFWIDYVSKMGGTIE